MKYYVVSYSLDKGVDDEWMILKTSDLERAKERARDEAYIYERDKVKSRVEIRVYEEDIDDEACTCFDYNTIEF